MTVDELAARIGWSFGRTRAVMGAMVADGLAIELDGRHWLAPALEPLRVALYDIRLDEDERMAA